MTRSITLKTEFVMIQMTIANERGDVIEFARMVTVTAAWLVTWFLSSVTVQATVMWLEDATEWLREFFSLAGWVSDIKFMWYASGGQLWDAGRWITWYHTPL